MSEIERRLPRDVKRRLYKILCGAIRRNIYLTRYVPLSETTMVSGRLLAQWKKFVPQMYANAKRSVMQSPRFD